MLQTIIGNATQPEPIKHFFHHSGFDSVHCIYSTYQLGSIQVMPLMCNINNEHSIASSETNPKPGEIGVLQFRLIKEKIPQMS